MRGIRAPIRACLTACLALQCAVAAAKPQEGRVMPATFEQGVVYLDMPAPNHSRVRMFTDSGGGTAFVLSTEAAKRLGLAPRATTDEKLLRWLGPNVRLTNASQFMARSWPRLNDGERFVIVPGTLASRGWPASADGVFGENWFAHQTWTWDYTREQLIWRPKDWRPATDAREFMVSFQSDAQGRRTDNYPLVMMRVDDAEIPMLFDTGAYTVLTPTALHTLNDGKLAARSTSMITHSVFEAWHQRHADWRIIDDAQLGTHSRMILVPEVRLASLSCGPVWFTERRDENYHEMMSSLMSDQVEGSIGGNAFGSFVITMDYPRSLAWIQTKSSRH
jgi:hypothetical protein